MEFKRGRYSWLLRPFLIIFDISVVNGLAFYYFNFKANDLTRFSAEYSENITLIFIIYAAIFWIFSSTILKFYRVFRYTSVITVLSLIIKQFLVFSIIIFAFVGLFRSVKLPASKIFEYIVFAFSIIGAVKLLSYYGLKTVRTYLKGNLRRVVIVGNNESAQELKALFRSQKQLGYKVLATFSDTYIKSNTGSIADSFPYLERNMGVDEVYCAIDDLTEKQVNYFVKIANINHSNIKFVPNTKKLFSKRLKTDFYNYLPVLSIEEVALNRDFNQLIKRAFDVIFSLFIIVFVLSWVTAILFLVIKLESKGPLFYKHKRNGKNYEEFTCYKFRSLRTTTEIKGTYVTENDNRVTRIGKFLRKTSIDELPQFLNVIKNEMSVVGPRPHMPSYTEDYSKKIDKFNFIFRHNVRPGITGLAQIKGYRGEIKTDEDIINRIKYDIFYIENWSLLLDIKIIFQTIINMFKGQDEAY
ncbi:exopolysaccharide biosynthesis polyprenyl glycosylphosphotransferase [Bizionia gelidisalsuginis]|uniref:Exopolysaccharide biosynthesis polyprenyl glycosylphosphotransferase n=1 Tax=Bizionia gelidisalsuginis TaxID=291188 RepID=A0ABY3MCN9_9FLAO|nr:exopolysaccharide biosynthesis polyprenyl glycosylphosphotransferase [Bizionia gelidisalsuginis]TYC15669.1 exopolysaccharide biosynthesis polyprenyl glycosylphosphotransferase [Bizionia gelidisalsuginis]